MTAPVYFIRHGRTAGNLEHRYVGVTDEPLCDEGIKELQECRLRLEEHFFAEGIAMPGRVYVSPMLRCRQSALVLFPNAKQSLIHDFREMNFGEFEYKNYAELASDMRYQAYIDSGGNTDFPAAETQAHFRRRVEEAFRQCIADNFENVEASMADGPEKPFVFCMHGGTIMAIFDAYSVPHRDYFEWQVSNASGFYGVLEVEKNGICLKNIEKLSWMAKRNLS